MTIKNNSLVSEIGAKAASAWNVASKEGDGGDALATHALFIAARVASFDAIVNRGTKAEPEIETVSFDLLQYDVDPFNSDGSVDMKLKAARTVAIAQLVFGLDELDNAVKQRIGRASKMALYLARRYSHLDDEEYMACVATRTVKVSRATGSNMTTCLVVPHEAIYSPPAEDADEEDKAYYERNRLAPKTLNGKDKASLAELGKRANPPKVSSIAGANERNDKGASFVASIEFVTAIVLQNCSETIPEQAVADVALSNETRRKLFNLSQAIAGYFAADPMEDADDIDFGQVKDVAA